jgi:hypothetical protein
MPHRAVLRRLLVATFARIDCLQQQQQQQQQQQGWTLWWVREVGVCMRQNSAFWMIDSTGILLIPYTIWSIAV